MPFPNKATQFPVNRQDHTQKGPHLTTILKKLLSAEWDFNDEKIKAMIKKLDLEETIEVALCLQRIMNGTKGDDSAIERIFERIDGKVAQKVEADIKGEIVMMPCIEKEGKKLDFNVGS